MTKEKWLENYYRIFRQTYSLEPTQENLQKTSQYKETCSNFLLYMKQLRSLEDELVRFIFLYGKNFVQIIVSPHRTIKISFSEKAHGQNSFINKKGSILFTQYPNLKTDVADTIMKEFKPHEIRMELLMEMLSYIR